MRKRKGEMRKMKDDNGGRDAACSVRMVLSLLFCGRSTLRPYMPTCPHAHMLCFSSLLYEVYPLLCPLRLGKF